MPRPKPAEDRSRANPIRKARIPNGLFIFNSFARGLGRLLFQQRTCRAPIECYGTASPIYTYRLTFNRRAGRYR
jgi:hypothetical protein